MEYRFILRITKYLFTENATKLGVMTLVYNLQTQEPKSILKNKKGMIQCLRVLKMGNACLVAKLQGSLCLFCLLKCSLWNYG